MWQPGTTQLSGAPGTMPITIAITELQRPPVPSVLSVQDRQVYVDNIEAPPPGYVLTRRWMRNDPDVDVEHLPGTHNALVLPRPLPHGPNSNDEPPAFPDDSEHYDPEEAVKSLKQHWVNVRQHDTAQRMQRVARYLERLKAVTTPGIAPAAVNMVVTQALLAQHQQASQGFSSLQAALVLQQQQQQQQGSMAVPAVSAALQASANGQLLLQQGLARQQEQQQQQEEEPHPGTQQQQQQQLAVDGAQEQDTQRAQDAVLEQPQEREVKQDEQQQQQQQQQDHPAAEQAEAMTW